MRHSHSEREESYSRPVARLAVLEMTEFEDEVVGTAVAPLPSRSSAPPRLMTEFEEAGVSPRPMSEFEPGEEDDLLPVSLAELALAAAPAPAASVSPELVRLAQAMSPGLPMLPYETAATWTGRWRQRLEKMRARLLRRELPGWSFSLALHIAIMLFLLATQLPAVQKFDIASVISTVIPEQDSAPLPTRLEDLAFKAEVVKQFGSDSDINTGNPGAAMATLVGDNPGTGLFSATEVTEQLRGPGPGPRPAINTDLAAPPEAELLSNVNIKGTSSEYAGGLEGAIDRLSFELAASLRERRTLVLWMFDASQSLKNRRNQIADRFENVYRQLHDLDVDSDKSLKTAVMWYGEKYGFITSEPVDDIRKVVDKVRAIPNDVSGKENVFSAILAGHKKFQNWGKPAGRNVVVIIVTDEKGDDESTLEQTIHLCRVQARWKCYVVGNAAPFGRQKGYVRWEYEDGTDEFLPVDQGPETILPEALQLGFWGRNVNQLELMSSGYGPYALTRLCAETGGLFLITEEDRRSLRFDPQIMRNYSPDYRPIAEYQKGVEKNRAKSALVAAATKTKLDAIRLPELQFRADTDAKLREELTEAQKPAAEMDYRLSAMHSLLLSGIKDRDKLTESRWKAGFDLALGRVLAMRVRIYGYNKILAEMKLQPKPFQTKGNDQWRLIGTDVITAGPDIKKMAKDANLYLKRVVDEHAGTPWAMMAERELSTPLGWEWEEHHVGYARRERERAEREAKRVRLADDEPAKQRERMRRQEREKPKL